MGFVLHYGFEGLRQCRPFGFGLNEVDLCQELVGVENLFYVRAYLVSKDGKDADDLPSLLCFQLAHLVVGLHHFGWFDEHGLTCCTLIVNDTIDTTLHLWRYWQYQSSVAHCGGCVLLHESVFLCCV